MSGTLPELLQRLPGSSGNDCTGSDDRFQLWERIARVDIVFLQGVVAFCSEAWLKLMTAGSPISQSSAFSSRSLSISNGASRRD